MERSKLWLMLDYNNRCFFLNNEFKRSLLKSIKVSTILPYWRRYHSSYLITNLTRASSSTMSVNRCLVSGRNWSISRNTNYDRFIFRTEALNSVIPGCSSASW